MDQYGGLTIKDSGIRDKFDISVVGIMDDDGKSIINPDSSEVLNTNQTIILIHGAGSISDAWDNFKKSFESMGNTVINPTLRYHQRGYKSDQQPSTHHPPKINNGFNSTKN